MDRLTGSLSSTGSLSGNLNNASTIAGMIQFADSTPYYSGEYEVTPKVFNQTLDTRGKRMADNVVVLEIPYYETSNLSGGFTAIIGGE